MGVIGTPSENVASLAKVNVTARPSGAFTAAWVSRLCTLNDPGTDGPPTVPLQVATV